MVEPRVYRPNVHLGGRAFRWSIIGSDILVACARLDLKHGDAQAKKVRLSLNFTDVNVILTDTILTFTIGCNLSATHRNDGGGGLTLPRTSLTSSKWCANDMYKKVFAYEGASVTPLTGKYDTKTVNATKPRNTHAHAPHALTASTVAAFSR